MTRIQLRGGTAAQWVTANPVLAAREPGVESDTGKQKIGDGVTPWNSLPYSTGGGGGSATNLGNSRTATAVTVTSSTGTPTALAAADASNAGVMTAVMQAKLAALATNAELRDRSTHTGQQPSSTISDFVEAVQDAVAALLAAGTNVTLSYNDAANTLTVAASGSGGLDAEAVRDAIGVALLGVGLITVTVNDAADTITISTTATQNSTDASLRDRGTHTGTQPASTISDFAETARDTLAAALVAGTNVTITPNDAADTITIAAANAADLIIVHTGNTARASGAGEFPTGFYVGRAFTATKIVYQFTTADGSGSTSVSLYRAGSAVASSTVSVSAANQVDGIATDTARTATINQSFAVGDRLRLHINSVGTTPGNGLAAYIVGTYN